ncbi:RNA-binding S4 domain-containing protein [Vibrio ruber]|uniref:RNA-binding S4 domain-containing protein n=1 Tax=Vibrio ruber TaxID=184755 RepID=UPI002893662F|nr:RNA-binding S4 domain-containing protein [Vibrio ruber]WNJ95890.1 RNA-binding S4 domain-containing protein [Vibrio ruber]
MQNHDNHADEAAEIEIEAIGIEVNHQPIELYKVLKLANVLSGGGEAKYAIAEGYVVVNGEVEQRKRCKIYDGDLVEFNGEYYLVICDVPVAEPSPSDTIQKKANKKASQTTTSEHASQHKSKNNLAKNSAAKKKSPQTKQQKTNPNSSTTGKNNQPEPDKKTTERDAVSGRNSIKFF